MFAQSVQFPKAGLYNLSNSDFVAFHCLMVEFRLYLINASDTVKLYIVVKNEVVFCSNRLLFLEIASVIIS